jgi:hypothetical protein
MHSVEDDMEINESLSKIHQSLRLSPLTLLLKVIGKRDVARFVVEKMNTTLLSMPTIACAGWGVQNL